MGGKFLFLNFSKTIKVLFASASLCSKGVRKKTGGEPDMMLSGVKLCKSVNPELVLRGCEQYNTILNWLQGLSVYYVGRSSSE